MTTIGLRRALLLGTAACALNAAASVALATVVTDGSGNTTITGAEGSYGAAAVVGTLTNQGTITAASSTPGITVNASVGGALINTGVITSPAADAIAVGGNVTGAFQNSGTITSGLTGVSITGSVGSFNNSGAITSSAAQAVQIGSVSGGVTNSGLISGAGSSPTFALGAITGAFVNNGTINAPNVGVSIGGAVGGFTNNGPINITQTGGSPVAVTIVGNVTGNLVNTGQIAVASPSTSSNSSFGIAVTGSVTGNVVQSGSNVGTQIGIYVSGGVAGDVSITSAIATTKGYGVEVGSLTVAGAFPRDTGVYVANAIGGRLVNSGVITSDATHSGVLVRRFGATKLDLVNSGTITGGNGVALDYSEALTANSTITNTGVITGAINMNAARANVLNLNGGSVTGTILGTGSTVNIGGNFTSGGAMNVSAINVNAGRFTLAHNVTATGGFTNASILQLNTTQTITGNYTQNAGATLAIGVNGAAGGKLVVSNTATLTAASKLDIVNLSASPSTAAQTYTVVSAGTGAYSGVTINTNPFSATATATKSVSGNDLIVTLTPVAAATTPATTTPTPTTPVVTPATPAPAPAPTPTPTPAVVQAAPTSNDAAVATALLGLFATYGPNNPNGPAVLRLINSYFGAASTLTLEQKTALVIANLSPASQLSNTQSASQFTTGASGAVSSRSEIARAGDNGVETGLSAGSSARNSAVWGQLMGFASKLDNQPGSGGNEATSAGIALGGDHLVTDRIRLGAAFAYGQTKVKGQGRDHGSRTDIDSYQLTAYGSYNGDDGWYANGQLGAGKSEYDQRRTLVFSTTPASASYDGDGWNAHIDVGRDFAFRGATVTPIAGLSYSRQTIDRFSENVTGITFAKSRVSSTQSDIGGQVSWRSEMNGATLIPTLRLSWLHDYERTPLQTTAELGGVTFRTSSKRPDADGAHLGAALAMYKLGDWQLQARYDGFLYSGYTGNAASLNLKVNF